MRNQILRILIMSSRSSFLCFICHSNVLAETSEESREKYREIVGINLCPDSQLCHICCHVLNKLSLFRSICLKRSLEFPVPFSEKGTINLQKADIEVHVVCPEAPCLQYGHNCRSYLFTYTDEYSTNENYNDDQNQYVALEDNKCNDYFNTINTYKDNIETEHSGRANDVIDNKNDVISDDYPIRIENDKYRDDPELLNDKIESVAAIHDDEIATDFTEHNDNFDCFIDDETKYENDVDKYNDTDNIEDFNEIKLTKEVDETIIDEKEVKVKKKKKKKSPKKILLSVEEQKAELEARRKEKKYLEAEFKCYNCALPFLFKDTYQAHMMRHEESNGEYQCEICTLRFASPAMQRIHAMRHARRCGCGSRLRRCGCDATLPPQRVACHLCGNLLKHAKGLQQHLKRVHMSKTSNRIHSCNICGESFPSQHTVRTHMIKHIRRKFPCGQCAAVCSSPYTLARHAKLHAGSRPRRAERRHNHLLECPVCMKICPNQRGLTLHMQAIHSNRKDHVCPHCDARYSTRPSLLRHIAQHTRKPEPKTAVCHICGSSFKDRSKLNRHLRNVCEKAKLEEQLDDLYDD